MSGVTVAEIVRMTGIPETTMYSVIVTTPRKQVMGHQLVDLHDAVAEAIGRLEDLATRNEQWRCSRAGRERAARYRDYVKRLRELEV